MIWLWISLAYITGIISVVAAGCTFGLMAKRNPQMLQPFVKMIMQTAMRAGKPNAVSTATDK